MRTLAHVLFEAVSRHFAPETATVQPRKPTTKHHLQRTADVQNYNECAAWMLFPGHFWQRTSNDGSCLVTNIPQNMNPVSRAHLKLEFGSWQRTWNYKTYLTHITLPTALPAGTRIREGNVWRGETQNAESRWKNSLKPAKLQTNLIYLNDKTHKGRVEERNKTSPKQDGHQEKIGQDIRTSERQESQERNKGERRRMI